MSPREPEGFEHVYHQYTIRSERRKALQQHLAARKIGSTVYYPHPLHLQPLYRHLATSRATSRTQNAPPRKSSPCRCTPNCERIKSRASCKPSQTS